VIETIDSQAFEQIHQRYRIKGPSEHWPKFLDLERWIDINIRRIREIELDLVRPKRILDLGCGAGYFLYIAQLLGHEGLGLDLDQLPMSAFLICFNRHKQANVWGVPEWEFFLGDLSKHLTPRGRVWLELNQEYDGTFYTPELKEFFQKRGAKIDRHKVIFISGLRAPASTSPVAW